LLNHRIAAKMKFIAGLLALGLIVIPAAASARGHGGGHHSSGRHSSGAHTYRGHATTFRTSNCKSAACFRKHPDGKYVHPITPRKHR
jgi:hypothetical protein